MAEITTEKIDDIHLISVKGEIDAGSSIYLDDALKSAMEQGEKKIIADLSGLDYISSAGLGVFISHLDEFKLKEIQLTLFGINETVKQVFDILGLEKLLTIVENKEAAISTFDDK
ncbi:STAS domain-containing protein [Ekhidna sp.]|uniref:STAS domain-containing protein n=1 Tax=Ekhidna sp. TaxID=2608089 RepID=UPI003CCBF9BD